MEAAINEMADRSWDLNQVSTGGGGESGFFIYWSIMFFDCSRYPNLGGSFNMAEFDLTNLERVDMEDLNDLREKQWEKSKIVFDSFFEYLNEKGLKETTAAQKTEMAAFFIMKYLFIYSDHTESILEVYDDEIRTFLGNWYIRKSWTPRETEMNKILTAIADFYTFLHKEGFIDKVHLKEIKEVCKDKQWFSKRLKDYFELEDEEFEEWLMEYNYDYY